MFDTMHKINDFINEGKIDNARNLVIKALADIEINNKKFPSILNHFIRCVGLYPYLDLETASWQEKFVYESFKVDVGGTNVTLHKEQSSLLKKLIDGKDIAVSAPTSFGKSFVVDSFIAINKPKNVMIIVPTIALTDETRRRIHKKFSHEYKIITTTDAELGEKNIFIFPQERATNYIDLINSLDILIIDEFYKASNIHDKERSPSLLRAILKLSKKTKQRYFLAPNIKHLNESIFTQGMEFISLDFNTVFLDKKNIYLDIDKDIYTKSDALLDIFDKYKGNTLIYAGTYSAISELATLIIAETPVQQSNLLSDFAKWLTKNYSRNWQLTNLVKRGCGIHNGQLHRSLSQIQIKLFEENTGLSRIISTSSIIEGVNTSAENVVLWRNKNGQPKLNDFTYRNIIGRGGRMFKHFIGNVFLLEKPPEEEENQLTINFSDELAAHVDENEFSQQLSSEQIAKIIAYKEEMSELLGEENYSRMQHDNAFNDSDSSVIIKVTRALRESPESFNGLAYLNSEIPENWKYSLYNILKIIPGYIGAAYSDIVEFICIIANNWHLDFPQLLEQLAIHDIGIDKFFDLERKASYKLPALLNEVNRMHSELYPERRIDISSFIAKISHAFLPPNVFILEEYGLPRMVSKKIHESGYIDLESNEKSIHEIIDIFNEIGFQDLCNYSPELDRFDKYILEHFYDGISQLK
ncbi:DEAD/DEAH box helicase [Shewanella xiamenensis]|nr:DEAD/DEAH box helicase [Shewanella xiamenensis]